MSRTCLALLVSSLAFVGCAEQEPVEADSIFAGPVHAERAPVEVDAARRRADLSVAASAAAAMGGGDTEVITFDIDNHGSRTARNVDLTIDLPTDGSLSAIDSRCTVSGAQAVCSIGKMRSGTSAQVTVDWIAPLSTTVLDFDGEATTTSRESSTSDNTDGVSISVTYTSLVIAGGETFYLTGCLASAPVSFADCATTGTLYNEQVTLNADNTVTANTTLDGFWTQPNAASVELLFADPATTYLVSYFRAQALDADCFDGILVYATYSAFGAFQMCKSGYPTP